MCICFHCLCSSSPRNLLLALMNTLLDQQLISPTGKAESKRITGTKVHSREQHLHLGKNLPFPGVLPLPLLLPCLAELQFHFLLPTEGAHKYIYNEQTLVKPYVMCRVHTPSCTDPNSVASQFSPL